MLQQVVRYRITGWVIIKTTKTSLRTAFQPGLTPRNCQQQFKRRGEIIGTIDYELDPVVLEAMRGEIVIDCTRFGSGAYSIPTSVEFSFRQATAQAERDQRTVQPVGEKIAQFVAGDRQRGILRTLAREPLAGEVLSLAFPAGMAAEGLPYTGFLYAGLMRGGRGCVCGMGSRGL